MFKSISFVYLALLLPSVATADPCVKDDFYQYRDAITSHSGSGEVQKLQPFNTFCKGVRGQDDGIEYNKIAESIKNSSDGETLTYNMMRLRSFVACGGYENNHGNLKTPLKSLENQIDKKANELHNPCTAYWQTQFHCLMNLSKSADTKTKFMYDSDENPGGNCPAANIPKSSNGPAASAGGKTAT